MSALTPTTNHTLTLPLRGSSVMSPNDPVKKFPRCSGKEQQQNLTLEEVYSWSQNLFIEVINELLLFVLTLDSHSVSGALPLVNTRRNQWSVFNLWIYVKTLFFNLLFDFKQFPLFGSFRHKTSLNRRKDLIKKSSNYWISPFLELTWHQIIWQLKGYIMIRTFSTTDILMNSRIWMSSWHHFILNGCLKSLFLQHLHLNILTREITRLEASSIIHATQKQDKGKVRQPSP